MNSLVFDFNDEQYNCSEEFSLMVQVFKRFSIRASIKPFCELYDPSGRSKNIDQPYLKNMILKSYLNNYTQGFVLVIEDLGFCSYYPLGINTILNDFSLATTLEQSKVIAERLLLLESEYISGHRSRPKELSLTA